MEDVTDRRPPRNDGSVSNIVPETFTWPSQVFQSILECPTKRHFLEPKILTPPLPLPSQSLSNPFLCFALFLFSLLLFFSIVYSFVCRLLLCCLSPPLVCELHEGGDLVSYFSYTLHSDWHTAGAQ